MEQVNNPELLNSQPEVNDQNQLPLTTSPAQKSFTPFLITGGVITLLLLFGYGGYYVGKNSSTGNTLITDSVPTPSPILNSLEDTEDTNNNDSSTRSLPSGWSYKDNGECGVKFAIPPKSPPYYELADPNRPPSVTEDKGSGRFWDFPRGGIYPNLLGKLILEGQEYKQASAMFASADEASGYISSAVTVSCLPNTDNLSNSEMLNVLKTKLQAFNQAPQREMDASSYIIKSSNEVTKWDNKVNELLVSEEYSNPGGEPVSKIVEYTIFTTPGFMYEVRVAGATTNSSVKNTAQQIFENLSFE